MPTKWTNKKTGEVKWVDDEGYEIKAPNENIVPKSAAIKSIMNANAEDYNMFRRGNPAQKTFLRPSDWQDLFFSDVGQYVKPALTTAGGIAGGYFGGPYGGMIGTGLGSGLGSSLQYTSPRLFGNPSDSIKLDVAKDVILDKVLETGTKAGAFAFNKNIRENLLQNFFKRHFGPTVDPSILGPNPAGRSIDLTVGQTHPSAEWIENVFAGKEKSDIVKAQQSRIGGWFQTKRQNAEELIQSAQEKANENVDMWRETFKELRGRFNPHIEKNTKTVEVVSPVKNRMGYGWGNAQPTSRFEKVEGAIPVIRSKKFADDVGNEIKKILGPDLIKEQSLGTGTGNPLAFLYGELEKIRGIRTRIDPETGEHMINPIARFKDLQEVKSQIYNYLGDRNINSYHRTRLEAGLKTLADTISADIDEGVKGWGKQAYSSYRKSQDYYKNMTDRLDPEIAKRLALTGRPDYEGTYLQLARKALSDPMEVRRFKEVTKDTKVLKDLFYDDMTNAAYDSANNTYNPESALNFLLKSKREVANEVLSDVSRKNLENYLRKASQVKAPNLNFGVLWNLRNLRAGSGLATITGLGLGNPYYLGHAAAGLTAGAYILPQTMKNIVKRTFLDPDFAKVVQGVTNIDAKTKNINAKLDAFFNAIRGARIAVQTPDGNWKEERVE